MEAVCTDAIREIQLTKGYVALVDDVDFWLVSQFNWRPTKSPKGRTYYAVADSGGQRFRMHRLILGSPRRDLEVDHRDGNGLNNCRSNLRLATHNQNTFNTRAHVDSVSRFKGVWFNKNTKGKAWAAEIFCRGRKHWIGSFSTEIEAAMAYDSKARELHGEFASLNFPSEVSA